MSAAVTLEIATSVATVTLSHPGKLNAMSRAMWRQLRTVFERIQCDHQVRCVVVAGGKHDFCAGGDISEYSDFRFQQASLRDFHELEVWGALQAMLDCDVPLVAQIEGHCMGAGIEIASCCDIRLAGSSARFGAPIARLGFPMAPREAALLAREAGLNAVRQMLLEAAILSASDMWAAGFLSRVIEDAEVATEGASVAARIARLAPQAARMNKRTVRALCSPRASGAAGVQADLCRIGTDDSYGYAESAEHREGIAAFLQKRSPAF